MNKRLPKSHQVDPTLPYKFLCLIHTILIIGHQARPAPLKLNQRPKLIQNLIAVWKLGARRSNSGLSILHATAPRQADVTQPPSHDLLDEIGISGRSLGVRTRCVAHVIGG